MFLQHQRLQRVSRQTGMATQAATSTIKAPADGDFYKYGLKPVLGEGIMDATLKRLGTVEIKEMDKSNFVKPKSVMYELDGVSAPFNASLSSSCVATTCEVMTASCKDAICSLQVPIHSLADSFTRSLTHSLAC